MNHKLLILLLPLLSACPSAQLPSADAHTPTPDPLGALIPLDKDRIDDEEAFAEALPPTPPSTLLGREGIPHHDPRYHDHFEEAILLLEEERAGDAADALRMAVFDAPDSAPTWMLLAETYGDLGRSRQALDCAREALRTDSDLPSGRAWMARHFLDRGDPEGARRHAERYARLRPEDPMGSHLLARTYMGLSMWDEAIRQERRTISRDPTFTWAYNNLGFSALQIGRNELALQYLEAATELDDLEAYMLNNLGVAYERLGRPVDALQAFADAVDLDPSYTPAEVNKDRVREIVDQQVADEVARILARRSRAERPDHAAANDLIQAETLDIATP
jgi:tetratricopeptide (TPR) repeat protein